MASVGTDISEAVAVWRLEQSTKPSPKGEKMHRLLPELNLELLWLHC